MACKFASLPKRRVVTFIVAASSTPHAILDASSHVVAVLVGRARDTFDDVIRDATSEFRRQSEGLSSAQEKNHKRGQFHAVLTGISYGGGQTVRRFHGTTAGRADW